MGSDEELDNYLVNGHEYFTGKWPARCIWDPAHRLEKADEHSRKKSPIIQKFYAQVHADIKYFRVGKQNIMLKKEAEALDVKAY